MNTLSFLQAHFPAGRLRGHEYVLGDLRGNPGRSLSINVHTGVWCDFATGESGRGVASLARAMGAGDILLSGKVPVVAASKDLWTPLPVARTRPLGLTHPRWGKPDTFWTYRTRDNRVIGYVCRWDTPAGKQILPHTQCVHKETGEVAWRWKSFAKPRPLYGLEKMLPGALIIVCEGEKAADACRKIYPDNAAVSWPGGCNAVRHADWTPLKGLTVLVWPDNDEPGKAAAEDISAILKGMDAAVEIMGIPPGAAKGWDAADALASMREATDSAVRK